MSDEPRTQIGDIAPVGAELEESTLRTINGGLPAELQTWQDPPGVCKTDVYG
ncbi:hypothetical protein [Streptosporangium sp. NPDC002607]